MIFYTFFSYNVNFLYLINKICKKSYEITFKLWPSNVGKLKSKVVLIEYKHKGDDFFGSE